MRPVPPELVAVIEQAVKTLEGKSCYGLPHHDLGDRLAFTLVVPGDCTLFRASKIASGDHPDWVPFATLGDDPAFLAISTVSPYPVGMWEPENGMIYSVWETIELFIAGAVDDRHKTPFEELEKVLDKVAKKIGARAYDDAIAILQPTLTGLGAAPEGQNLQLGRAHRLYGRALQGVGRTSDARQAYERAISAGDPEAEIHLVDLVASELGDPNAALETAARLAPTLDDNGRNLLQRYVAEAYLRIGDLAQAEAQLRDLLARCTDAPTIRDARDDLERYIEDDSPGAEPATAFLDWFKR